MELEKSWKKEIEKRFDLSKLLNISDFLLSEKLKGKEVFPKKEEIFLAFDLTPLDKVKVVIVGQDPYHGVGEAHGLAFSVKNTKKTPPSLKNIFKEISRDLKVDLPKNGDLTSWARQGVFLFNTTLSVEKDRPHSHRNIGWEGFTKAVFEVLSEKRGPVVFLFWGKAALHYSEEIEKTKNPKFLVLKASHPSPFSVKGFSGCSHFSKVNEFLEFWGENPIDWTIEN